MGISLEILFGSENGFACKRKPHAEDGVYYISFKKCAARKFRRIRLQSSEAYVITLGSM